MISSHDRYVNVSFRGCSVLTGYLFTIYCDSDHDISCVCLSVFLLLLSTALYPGIRWHNCSASDPGRASLYWKQQRCQEPTHLHHILCVGCVHIAPDHYRNQVVSPLGISLIAYLSHKGTHIQLKSEVYIHLG